MCNSLEIVGNAIQAATARGVYVTREVFCEAVGSPLVVVSVVVVVVAIAMLSNG